VNRKSNLLCFILDDFIKITVYTFLVGITQEPNYMRGRGVFIINTYILASGSENLRLRFQPLGFPGPERRGDLTNKNTLTPELYKFTYLCFYGAIR